MLKNTELTPWSRVVSGELIVVQLVKEFITSAHKGSPRVLILNYMNEVYTFPPY